MQDRVVQNLKDALESTKVSNEARLEEVRAIARSVTEAQRLQLVKLQAALAITEIALVLQGIRVISLGQQVAMSAGAGQITTQEARAKMLVFKFSMEVIQISAVIRGLIDKRSPEWFESSTPDELRKALMGEAGDNSIKLPELESPAAQPAFERLWPIRLPRRSV
jgi:hypothetical protein